MDSVSNFYTLHTTTMNLLFIIAAFVAVTTAQSPGGSPCNVDGDCISGNCGNNGICCGGDWVDCSGDCVNTQTDENNCGGCGVVCSVGEICIAGDCLIQNATSTGMLLPSFTLSLSFFALSQQVSAQGIKL